MSSADGNPRDGELDWEDTLDRWNRDLHDDDLAATTWVTLTEAEAQTSASRSALRSWYRTGQVPSRLIDGAHGPQRLVSLEAVVARAAQSPRIRRKAEPAMGTASALEALARRVTALEREQRALRRRIEQLAQG